METVFDHAITPQELYAIAGNMPKEEYIAIFGKCQDSENHDIAFLYNYRGNKRKTKEYAGKLPNSMKVDFYRTIFHP
ncbi:MAG: hypothetical protein AB7C90_02340 [Bacteroidales bacterium]